MDAKKRVARSSPRAFAVLLLGGVLGVYGFLIWGGGFLAGQVGLPTWMGYMVGVLVGTSVVGIALFTLDRQPTQQDE